MTIIGAASTEWVVCFRKQLEHELFWRHAQSEQHGVVSVISVEVVLGLQLETRRNLNGLMAIGTGMNILGGQLRMRFKEIGHSPARTHELESF